jgi:GNAT superfamily N-acetyltransferase
LDKIKFSKKDLGYIALVSVEKDFQGQSIGKKLVKKALEVQKEWGSKAILVHASKSSGGNASEKLFSFFGFIPIYLHEKPWREYSKEKGPKGFWCNFCGNPCICDELEMVKYL